LKVSKQNVIFKSKKPTEIRCFKKKSKKLKLEDKKNLPEKNLSILRLLKSFAEFLVDNLIINLQFTLLKTKPYELLKKKDKFNH
jgi:hypothetical protein